MNPHIWSTILWIGVEASTAWGIEITRSGRRLLLTIVVENFWSVVNSVIVVSIEFDSAIPVITGTEMRILNSCYVEVPLIVACVQTHLDVSYFVYDWRVVSHPCVFNRPDSTGKIHNDIADVSSIIAVCSNVEVELIGQGEVLVRWVVIWLWIWYIVCWVVNLEVTNFGISWVVGLI